MGMRASYDAWGANSMAPQHAGQGCEKGGSAIFGLYQVFALLQFCCGTDGIEKRVCSSCETLESFFHEVPENR